MSGTPANQGAWTPASDHNAIPWALARKLEASAQIGKGQFATVAPATGYAALNDGTKPGQISAGNGDVAELSDTSPLAGAAAARFSQRWFYGLQASAAGGDGFTDADFCVPFFIASENTLGKKSNNAGSNRSIGGLVFGLGIDGTPYAWDGPVAWCLARSVHANDNASAGEFAYPADAGAAVDYAAAIPIARSKTHGVLTAVEIIPSATLAVTVGDDRLITITKRDSLGVAAPVVVATFDSTTPMAAPNAANCLTAYLPTQFALSGVAGALDMLETDYLTIENSHAGLGAIVPASAVRALMKVV